MNCENPNKFKAISNKVHDLAISHMPTYDFIFFAPVEPEIKLVDDGVRYQSREEWLAISKKIEAFLILEGAKYHTITGDVDAKAKKIEQVLTEKGVFDIDSL